MRVGVRMDPEVDAAEEDPHVMRAGTWHRCRAAVVGLSCGAAAGVPPRPAVDTAGTGLGSGFSDSRRGYQVEQGEPLVVAPDRSMMCFSVHVIC